MDRENHNHAIFYGVNCTEQQMFICEQSNTTFISVQNL